MRLRTDGALRRPPPQDVHLGAGAADTGTRLLLLRRLPRRHLSARPGVGLARHVAVARRAADGVGLAASDFSFAAASGLLWELAAVRVETKQVERAAEALGREVAADERDVADTVPSPAPTMYLRLPRSRGRVNACRFTS